MSQARSRLRAALAGSKMVLAPFVYDALQAKIAEYAGFEAVYMTGFGTAAARGLPDLGLLTLTEMAQNVRSIGRAVEIPVDLRRRHRLRQPAERDPHDRGVRSTPAPRPSTSRTRCCRSAAAFCEGKQVIPLRRDASEDPRGARRAP